MPQSLKPLNYAPILLGIVFFCVKLVQDAPQNLYQTLSLLSASLILIFVTFTVVKLYWFFRLETCTENKWALIGLSLFSLLMLKLSWPGAVSFDDLAMLSNLATDRPSDWHSITYSFIAQGFITLTGLVLKTSLLNWFLYVNVLLVLLSFTTWKVRSFYFWLFLFLMCFPQNLCLVFFQNRDAVNGSLLLIFTFGLLSYKKARHQELRIHWISLLVIGCLLGEIRQEGRVILFLTPFLLAYFCFQSRVKTLISVGAVVFSFFIMSFALPAHFYLNSYSKIYQSTLFIHPVTYIVHKIGVEALSPEEKKAIDDFISLENITKYYNPYDISPFHLGGIRQPEVDAHFQAFQWVTGELILKHFDFFLESRAVVFLRMFNFVQETLVFEDFSLESGANPLFAKGKEKFNYAYRSSESEPALRIFYNWQNLFFTGLPWVFHMLLASCLIPFLALGFFTVQHRKNQGLALISGLFLSRALFFTVVAGGAYWKYISTTWTVGWILLLVYLSERQKA